MEKLPSTSYVRLVDIWLICGQLIPFIEVILLTLKELYNKEDDGSNHHGFVRRASSIFPVSFQYHLKYIPEGLSLTVRFVIKTHPNSSQCFGLFNHKLGKWTIKFMDTEMIEIVDRSFME